MPSEALEHLAATVMEHVRDASITDWSNVLNRKVKDPEIQAQLVSFTPEQIGIVRDALLGDVAGLWNCFTAGTRVVVGVLRRRLTEFMVGSTTPSNS